MKKTALFRKIFLGATAALLSSVPLCAEYNKFGIPDSSEIRKTIQKEWLTAPLNELRFKPVESRSNEIGLPFHVSLEETQSTFNVVVAPRTYRDVQVVDQSGSKMTRMELYPAGAPGSWVLSRNVTTGKPVSIRWYFNQDSDVYLQFRPDGAKTLSDLCVYGFFAARSVPVGIPFDRLYTASFSQVYDWTKDRLPWKKVTVTPGQYHPSLQMSAVIRENLKNMDYVDEACYDENRQLRSCITGQKFKSGATVRIDDNGNVISTIEEEHVTEGTVRLSLGGPGFAKWVVDGLVQPLTGNGTNILELQTPTTSVSDNSKNGVRSQKYNLSFTLDWCRNLAVQALNSRSSRDFTVATGGVDVTVEPFAAEVKDGKISNSTGYIPNTGYEIKVIKPLLYVLGNTEPGYFYLCAIRETSSVHHDEMVFNQCAVLFPYFDDSGRFCCNVFDKGQELSLEAFCARYSGSFVHLERVRASDYFIPQK